MPIITIDGPAGAGKGTLARRLAAHFDFAYLESGLLYRAVARTCLDAGVALDAPDAVVTCARRARLDAILKGRETPENLRGAAVDAAASRIAALPALRRELLPKQRRFAAHPPGGQAGVVVEGRDMGTVVFPDADVKFFLTADEGVRHARRAEVDGTRAPALKERDTRDINRRIAPLHPSPDAHLLDTTDLGIEDTCDAACRIVKAHIGPGR